MQLSDHKGPWSRCSGRLKRNRRCFCEKPLYMWFARTRPCASSLGITFSKNFHVWALFSKTLYLGHSSPQISTCEHELLVRSHVTANRVVPTYCTGIQPTTKATELPRVADLYFFGALQEKIQLWCGSWWFGRWSSTVMRKVESWKE